MIITGSASWAGKTSPTSRRCASSRSGLSNGTTRPTATASWAAARRHKAGLVALARHPGGFPRLPLAKPRQGRYHLVRFIRSDRRLDMFGEKFELPVETTHAYVVATAVDDRRKTANPHRRRTR